MRPESRLEVTRGGVCVHRGGELLLNGYRGPVWGDEKVSKKDSGGVCTAL